MLHRLCNIQYVSQPLKRQKCPKALIVSCPIIFCKFYTVYDFLVAYEGGRHSFSVVPLVALIFFMFPANSQLDELGSVSNRFKTV